MRLRFLVQVVVLNLSFLTHRARNSQSQEWIVGPYEIAGMVYRLAQSLSSARSVILARHPFFNFDYGWAPSERTYPASGVLRSWLLGPWKLGELARTSVGFIYMSAEGFLNSAHDQRDYEFRFLKKHGLRIATYFTGNDIRSPRLMKELERETGRPNLGTYLGDVNRVFTSVGYDDTKRAIAAAANRYSDVVFNADLDQRSYLERPSHPFFYFHPDSEVTDDFSKFESSSKRVIVHAPSAPILKGTQLVRAAIDQLRAEGYEFEYIELTGVSHEIVTSALNRAHIVLNEFYSYVPGVFGVEAMAAGCALLTSADEHLDRQLPPGSNEAWLVTEHFRVTDHLRELLEDPLRTRAFAVEGRNWVLRNALASVSGKTVDAILLKSLEQSR
ncbi:glycosyltransferase [Lacisediminihabitans sp. H27-G8]|uniref:glycosyltransferase n=1 Tax=Lacisediminihabitans sp. H27-G8 TaxID=3111909 RepID=UPI0038FD0677